MASGSIKDRIELIRMKAEANALRDPLVDKVPQQIVRPAASEELGQLPQPTEVLSTADPRLQELCDKVDTIYEALVKAKIIKKVKK